MLWAADVSHAVSDRLEVGVWRDADLAFLGASSFRGAHVSVERFLVALAYDFKRSGHASKRAHFPQRNLSGYRSGTFDDHVNADRRHADPLG